MTSIQSNHQPKPARPTADPDQTDRLSYFVNLVEKCLQQSKPGLGDSKQLP